MKLAIFDLDGTVLRGNSWRVYFWWMVCRRPRHTAGLLCALARRAVGLLDGRGMREAALAPLRGLDASAVRAVGVELVARRLSAQIRPRARQEMARCATEGYEPVLATGAFDFVAEVLAAELGIRKVVCTRLEYGGDGLCAGRIQRTETRGRAKAEAVRAMFERQSVDWEGSCAFSDDMEDAPLFALVGRPVLVTRESKAPEGIEVANWD